MTSVDDILTDELGRLMDGLRAQVTDPDERVKIIAMAADAALLPLRLARGEDVAPLVAALRAEAANRALTQRTKALTLAQQAWIGVLVRILAGALV